jgi:outer membrane protein TolC
MERARKQVEEARLTRRDPPELKFGFREDRGGDRAGVGRSVGVMLRVPFGTDDRNLVRDAKVFSELEVAELAARRTDERLATEVDIARRALATTQVRLDAAGARVAAARERLVLLERAFKAGELSVAELLRTRIAASQAETALHRLQAEHGLARARLLQAYGILP